ncbi:STAS domain-containing protein [Amycolatopsis sp. CA-128772]|uniref:STAS domain-containing protein n=1 Tax=Amycolatopsis sp. CA-128772 TaxID=2073159 RepID=UPI001304C598|nr:STAS domain-containing protein [Amycolatopsis sp. CA-128772]
MNDDVADPTQIDDALQLTVREETSSEALVLAVAGDVDLLTADQLRDAVTAAFAQRPAVLVIDLTAVTFLDSSGLSVLAQAHATGGQDTTVRVVTVPDSLAHRAITVTGMAQLLPVFTSSADALAADPPR